MSLKRLVDELSSHYRTTSKIVSAERASLRKARREFAAAVEAQRHVQRVAKEVQQRVHRRVAAVVTRCLAAVFDDAPTFEIEFVQRRGKTEANLWLVRNGRRTDPKEDSGGVRDVVALALRLAKLLSERPPKRRLLVLDEPYRGVHGEDNQRRAAALIQALSREMKVQFLIVTGLDWLKVGKVVEL